MHGALLDAEILADVYLLMTGGQTALFSMDTADAAGDPADAAVRVRLPDDRPKLKVITATPDEVDGHTRWLDELDQASEAGSVWRRLLGG